MEGKEKEKSAAGEQEEDTHDDENEGPNEALDPNIMALKGLMRQLGGLAIQGINPTRLAAILEGLRAVGEEDRQFICIQELNEVLSMGNEETLRGFAVDDFLPALTMLLHMEHNPEMMLMACRAIANMAEALPSAIPTIANSDAIPLICARLTSVEYIDLAEQAILTLEKISVDCPGPLLKAGALSGVLAFLDFFPTGVQRSAVSAAANLCRKASSSSFYLVVDCLPILTGLLSHHDVKTIEKACLAFARLVESFARNPSHLKTVGSLQTLKSMVVLISFNSNVPISPATSTMVIKTLATLCRNCPSLGCELLEETDVLNTLKEALVGSDPGVHREDRQLSSPSHASRSMEQLANLLALSSELLPPLPKPEAQAPAPDPLTAPPLAAQSASPVKSLLKSRKKKEDQVSPRSPSDEKVKEDGDVRAFFLASRGDIAERLATEMLPIFISVYSTTISSSVRQNCLDCIVKIIFYSPPELLKQALKELSISSFVASLLGARDLTVVDAGLQMGEFLMAKLPDIFRSYFKKEGVVHELEKLLPSAEPEAPQPQAPAELQEPPSPSTPSTPSPSSSSSGSSMFNSSRRFNELMRKFRDKPQSPETEEPPSPKTPKPGSPPAAEGLKSKISATAQRLYERYFSEGGADEVSSTLGRLQEAAKTLSSPTSTRGALFEALVTLRDLLSEAKAVSAFELVNSGAMSGLLHLLTGDTPDWNVPREGRIDDFRRVFMAGPETVAEKAVAGFAPPSSPQALSTLVKRLNEAFTKADQLPVHIYELVGGGGETKGALSGLRILAQSLRLRLEKMESETEPLLKNYAENAVMIEPLASIQSIENFLFPKVAEPALIERLKTASSEHGQSLRDSISQGSRNRNDSEVYDINDSAEETTRSQEASSSSEKQAPQPRLDFFFNSHYIPPTMSIFQAIQKYAHRPAAATAPSASASPSASPSAPSAPPPQSNQGRFKWSSVHSLQYRLHAPSSSPLATSSAPQPVPFFAALSLAPLLDRPLALDCPNTDVVSPVLTLLRILCGMSLLNDPSRPCSLHLPFSEFANSKMAAKLSRQLQDPLSLTGNAFPDWCQEVVRACPFLFPFETRYMYLYSTAFGVPRALMRLQERSQEQGELSSAAVKVGRLQRLKVRIDREKLLESALKIFHSYADIKAMLEIEYFGEAGTGLGPTLEFYTNLSREFQKKTHRMWREDSSASAKDQEGPPSEYVVCPSGLFPRPLSKEELGTDEGKRALLYFQVLGKMVAKGLLDFRTMDLPFNPLFYRLLAQQKPQPFLLSDFQYLDRAFGQSLLQLQAAALERRAILEDSSLSKEQQGAKISEIRIAGSAVEDLSLDFTLPNYPHIKLKPNGQDVMVTIDNLEEYLELVERVGLRESVAEQMRKFREGFSSLFDISHLNIFSSFELDVLFNGTQDQWDAESLAENIKADHGYTAESGAIQKLVALLSNFTPEQQRQFLTFVTGSPRLPIGGLRALHPKLTVVRKTGEGVDGDAPLPSAMTCANYLKLPDYSSLEVMRQKLLFAMTEGINSFHLS